MAIGFIFREDTTARAFALALLLAGSPLAAQFDPRQPYLTAAGKQALKPGVNVTRWFEIELKNASEEPRTASLRVFQCNGEDAQLSGVHALRPGEIKTLPLTRETPCATHVMAASAAREKPDASIYIVVAFAQPVKAGLELAVRAQYLQGDTINLHSSPGSIHPPAKRELRTLMGFGSALLINLSDREATMKTCALPAADWARFSSCRAGAYAAKVPAGGAVLVDTPGDKPTLEFRAGERDGFIEILPFEASAGERKRYQVDSSIVYSEPK